MISCWLQNELVLPLKDPTSDMAVIARNGSKLVKDIRDKKEASKSRARFWEVAGSKIGQITGELETRQFVQCRKKERVDHKRLYACM